MNRRIFIGVLLKIILYLLFKRGNNINADRKSTLGGSIIVKKSAEIGEPDHNTTVAFILTNGEVIKSLFTQTIMKCAEL